MDVDKTDSQAMNGMTAKQTKALHKLREQLKDVLKPEHDDQYLCRWLRARCFDVAKAEAMYRTSMKYREKMRVDYILDEYAPPEVICKYLTGGFCGFDKEGSPVRVELFGYLDMRGLMCSCRRSDLEKTKLLQCESIVRDWQKQSKKLNKTIDGLTVIFDMEKVGTRSLWKPGLDMYLHLVKVLEDNYPEMMKKMYVINAPGIFPLLWKICRPLISEDMKNKISVLGGNYKDVLLEAIDTDQLPACYGGNMVDPDGDPNCPSKICRGGDVPQSYYLKESVDISTMEKATIGQGKTLKIPFDVDMPGSLLRWEFRTDDYDVGFGVVYLGDGQEKAEEEVVPMKRHSCHQVTEDGSIACANTGSYVAVFDNRYSWTRTKCVFYTLELHTSDSIIDSEVDAVTSGGSWTRLAQQVQITKM